MTSQIVIVEDERLVAQDIAQLLKDEGYTICAIAADGKTAIQKIIEFSPDLVLLDIRIKGEIDGIEVAEHIQSFYAIPVIFLTAFSDAETLKRAQATHPMGYVLKPFRREQLLSSITIALSTYQNHKIAPEPEKIQSSYRLKSTITYIHDHLHQNINLEMLAGAIGMNPSYFCRVFQQDIGCSPYQFIIQQRVEKAKTLLKNRELTISDIALQCGFANHSHLDRHFLKIVGITPKAYRSNIF
ncbi:DNA-binding domain-containing protein, AraC-type [Synechococcus sp. PCC 7502]|uniref:response regulator transcription factor n=1 Tax=Synechococcus sp. PCC 7502 TaxID=1173263 RepID=UPI00029FA1B3|nr:response regulator transcription factor [Synechococcus sp. PCC 7502]AFY73804.1 DNA-binding domain-containing protein, AraC-type [Synechococcus sp. PCC 7502]